MLRLTFKVLPKCSFVCMCFIDSRRQRHACSALYFNLCLIVEVSCLCANHVFILIQNAEYSDVSSIDNSLNRPPRCNTRSCYSFYFCRDFYDVYVASKAQEETLSGVDRVYLEDEQRLASYE